MKVKIGDKIYDGDKEMVMVILTKKNKKDIASMSSSATMYCEYPEGTPVEDVRKFMGIKKSRVCKEDKTR